jgi:antitoxin (DNA-binding transcriptional repressor) of toxin-antitoxin stability system
MAGIHPLFIQKDHSMTFVTETLHAIERRAERAVVQELRLMTQEILALRTHLMSTDRTHADTLLLKLDHLERCQRIDVAAPPAMMVHFYSHDLGELERVALVETLAAAAQLVRLHLADKPRPVWQVTHRATDGELAFLTDDDRVLARIVPCEPSAPDVTAPVTESCAALAAGNLAPLRRLFVTVAATHQESLAA